MNRKMGKSINSKIELTPAERIISAIRKLDEAGMLDVEIEVYTNGECKTAEELAESLEDELNYAADASM